MKKADRILNQVVMPGFNSRTQKHSPEHLQNGIDEIESHELFLCGSPANKERKELMALRSELYRLLHPEPIQ